VWISAGVCAYTSAAFDAIIGIPKGHINNIEIILDNIEDLCIIFAYSGYVVCEFQGECKDVS